MQTTTDQRAFEGFPPSAKPLPPDEARALILSGKAPSGLRVKGLLSSTVHHSRQDYTKLEFESLPPGLTVDSLDLSGNQTLRRLPEGLRVKNRLNVSDCPNLEELPPDLRCYELEARNTPLQALPPDPHVEYRLDLSGCIALRELPPRLKVGSLILRDCAGLEALPEGLETHFLDISGCINLVELPSAGAITFGRLNASGCIRLRALPDWLTHLSQLNLSGCVSFERIPDSLHVGSWIDIAHTRITFLPENVRDTPLRWRGVPIDHRIAFRPETITANEVLAERNAELRRVLLDRMGYEAFITQAQAQVVDSDVDPGGRRQLLRVTLPGDEDLVCLSVICPSTERQYVIRVPPTIGTCHQAAAWIAGFDNANDYRPLRET